MFRAEAHSLTALNKSHTVTVPEVIEYDEDYLLLSYYQPGSAGNRYWDTLAQQLANMHMLEAPCFGFENDNFCGLSPQPNPRYDNGFNFFSEQRLLYQGNKAANAGLLDLQSTRQLEQLCARLEQFIPNQEPALIHGDLWSGNHFADKTGAPVVVDPAAHWGWPEADLAMMTLFGSPPEHFFNAYQMHRPLEPDWHERFGIYNLYHLLNHLNLFGGSYLSGIKSTLNRYC